MERDWWQLTPRRDLYSVPECLAAADSRVRSCQCYLFSLNYVDVYMLL